MVAPGGRVVSESNFFIQAVHQLVLKLQYVMQTISQPARIRPDQLKRVQNRTRSGENG